MKIWYSVEYLLTNGGGLSILHRYSRRLRTSTLPPSICWCCKPNGSLPSPRFALAFSVHIVGEALNAKINVFLLAGNRLFREALGRILRTKNDLNVAGSECCSPQAVEEVERSNSDVLLIDPMIGESCDIPLVQRISYANPTAKTILIDMLEDEAIFLKAVHAGVVGYLLQQASALDVVEAVRSVHQGEAVCPPRLCMALFKHLSGVGSRLGAGNDRHGKIPARLTRREQHLIPLISQGLTNKEIASQLNLSEQTVKNHIHRILQRMGAGDRFAAVEMARDRNLLLQA